MHVAVAGHRELALITTRAVAIENDVRERDEPTEGSENTEPLPALNVLAPRALLDALAKELVWTNNGGADLSLPDYLWLPALSARGMPAPTQNLRSEGSYSGFVPTFNISFALAQ